MNAIVPCVGTIVIMFAITMTIWHFGKAQNMLETWATENSLTILEQRRRVLMRGPFFFSTSKGQEVYSVTVRDSAGQVKRGYVRIGGYFLGLATNRVEVRWRD